MQTTIKLEHTTRERLKEFGCKGETYNELLMRLMDELEPRIELHPRAIKPKHP